MKKKILSLALIVICLSIITGSTLAYFTMEDTARNVITSAGVRIEVVEQQEINGTLQPYPAEPITVMPGTTVSKIVSVNNLQQPAWIRANYTVTVYDPTGKAMELSAAELASIITVTADGETWKYENGWYYFPEVVPTGEATKPLIEEVAFSGPNMGNEYQNCTIIVDVTAQAVQYVHNGETYKDALGWPEA